MFLKRRSGDCRSFVLEYFETIFAISRWASASCASSRVFKGYIGPVPYQRPSLCFPPFAHSPCRAGMEDCSASCRHEGSACKSPEDTETGALGPCILPDCRALQKASKIPASPLEPSMPVWHGPAPVLQMPLCCLAAPEGSCSDFRVVSLDARISGDSKPCNGSWTSRKRERD